MERFFLISSGIHGFLAVALGAFGAHGLRARLADAADGPRRLQVWETGAHYHLMHALALAVVAYLCTRTESTAAPVAGHLFTAGIVLFSGSLYVLTLTGVRALGAITPLGGVCFLAGWISLVMAALRIR